MSKNTILANLKTTALCTVLPLLVASCGTKNENVDAELTDVDTQISITNAKRDSLQNETDKMWADSLSRDERIKELHTEIAMREKEYKRLTAPKDSIMRKRYNRKLGSLKMDSMLRANRLREEMFAARRDTFRAVYNELDILNAKRDSLMKIKTR